MTSSEVRSGQLLDGRYRIGTRIARGGMATVYTALDTRLDRTVALKVMHPGLGDDDEFTHRFVREARAAARLSSPNVVAVFDQGTDQGSVYLVMEYVPGRTLRDVVRDRAPLAPAESLRLLEPLLSALAAAHAAGLVHRDVKPENVLIGADGVIKVADFGLARAVSSDTTATRGLLMGTVSYIAPELVLNQPADPRCDVYACGVVLYELLTGAKPHAGESAVQVAYQHVHADVPPPSARAPGIPTYVDALVARATARDRDQRPPDAKALLQQVRRVRSAAEAGLRNDDELTQDLTPRLATMPLPAGTDVDGWFAPPRQVHTEATRVVASVAEREAAVPLTVGADNPEGLYPHTFAVPSSGRISASRRRRRGWVLAVLVLTLALAAALGGWYLGSSRFSTNASAAELSQQAANTQPGLNVVSKSPPLAEVPHVVALTPSNARAALREAGFRVRVHRGLSYLGGFLVVGQDPSGGSSAPVGSIVTLAVV